MSAGRTEVLLGEDLLHDADLLRLVTFELPCREQQVHRGALADDPRQRPADAPLGDEAAAGEGGGEGGVRGV